ncbi:dehydroascorbate reductase 2 [Tanacetum coccineum]
MEGEAIMICIDTSRWMMGNNSHMFKQQADAIRLYCTQKFKSHEDTVVGICGMEASMGGDLMLVTAVMKAHTVWFGCWDKDLGNHLPKRIAVFAGGPVYEEMGEVQILGKAMKDRNVACDVISFGDPAINKQQLFKTLIDAADNNGNCNLLHVPSDSSVHDALLRSHVGGSRPLASSVHQESSKPHKKAAASYPESLDPHDHPAKINALSQSVVDLKLENVKPNSQPETLDQRIERMKRELDSLIKLKNKQVAC